MVNGTKKQMELEEFEKTRMAIKHENYLTLDALKYGFMEPKEIGLANLHFHLVTFHMKLMKDRVNDATTN